MYLQTGKFIERLIKRIVNYFARGFVFLVFCLSCKQEQTKNFSSVESGTLFFLWGTKDRN